MRQRLRHALLPLFLLLLISYQGSQATTQKVQLLSGTLPIQVKSTVVAGDPLAVTVGPVHASNEATVTLLMFGSYGTRVYQAAFRQGSAHFLLPAKDTQQSGLVTLHAQAGDAYGDIDVAIQPGPPIEPLTPLVGARFIIADADHWSMAIVVPFDAFGNPVAEGTPVQLQILHPGNKLERQKMPVRHLLAWRRVWSRTKSGRTIVVAQIGSVHGSAGTLQEVPGWPVPFRVSADPQPLPADGQQLTTLRTEVIRDRFGNAMPDGTLITFIVIAHNGTRSYLPAYTIDGVAETPFQAPREAGTFTIQATVLGVESKSYTLVFTKGPALGTFPVKITRDAINHAYQIEVGPLLGNLGQYIPDGTPVYVQMTDRSGHTYGIDTVSDSGYAKAEVITSAYAAGDYAITVSAGDGQGHAFLSLP